jgi:hypothetical protein
MNLFAQKYTGQRMDFTGNAGFKFTPAEALSVTAPAGTGETRAAINSGF